ASRTDSRRVLLGAAWGPGLDPLDLHLRLGLSQHPLGLERTRRRRRTLRSPI
ncbi:unnamed protein product, partial [Tenebrio molitor]